MIKAIHNNVVLQKKVVTSSSGIYMPTNSCDIYVVLNIGPEVSTVKVGQNVVLDKTPKLVKEGMEEYYITCVDNILAYVEE